MAEHISFDDVVSIFQGCLLERRGELVRFEEAFVFGKGCKARLLVLKTGLVKNVIFHVEDFKAPTRRIGYVNANGHAVLMERCPRRVYKAGWHESNTTFTAPGDSRALRQERAVDIISMRSAAIYEAYIGNYPTLEVAAESAVKLQSAVAFDKQFAITCRKAIFYKNVEVGSLVDGKIQFNLGKEYLSTLLDGNYEKDSRNFTAGPL